MSVRTILQRAGRAGAWILVGLQPGLHIRRRSWSRHKADGVHRPSCKARATAIFATGDRKIDSYIRVILILLGRRCRFGSEADMCNALARVRFTPNSGLLLMHVR